MHVLRRFAVGEFAASTTSALASRLGIARVAAVLADRPDLASCPRTPPAYAGGRWCARPALARASQSEWRVIRLEADPFSGAHP